MFESRRFEWKPLDHSLWRKANACQHLMVANFCYQLRWWLKKKLPSYINSLKVVLPWWPTRLQISSDAQGFSSLHRLFILIFKSEDSYAWYDKHVKVSCPLPSCLGSSSRGHYQAIYQPPEGVYLLNLCITYLTHNALSDWLKIDFYFRLNQ